MCSQHLPEELVKHGNKQFSNLSVCEKKTRAPEGLGFNLLTGVVQVFDHRADEFLEEQLRHHVQIQGQPTQVLILLNHAG